VDIRIVSKNDELIALLREILSETVGQQVDSISVPTSEVLDASADLYIWDFDQESCLLPEFNRTRFVIVLARLEDVQAVQAALGSETILILKPVSRAMASAILSSVVLSRAPISRGADIGESLRYIIRASLTFQEYDKSRTEFLARVVHDLRAPLTALTGYCSLLLGAPIGSLNDIQRQVVERMHQSVRRLSRLTDDMFQISVAGPVHPKLELKRGDMKSCLFEAVDAIAGIAVEKRILLNVDLKPSGDQLFFDADQIARVLINILENACKFAPRHGHIRVRGYRWFWDRRSNQPVSSNLTERRRSISEEPNSYRLDVCDSGAPIPEVQLGSIFGAYVSYSRAEARGGTGLGLAICRGIIEQHQGRVWAENTTEGPSLSFVLPLRPASSAETNPGVPQSLSVLENAKP
jgi:signal transduction histidine kinase